MVRDQPGRERRDGHRRHAHAGRDQRHREAAPCVEPAGDAGHHRREERAVAPPTSRPKMSWNCTSEVARLASARLAASTTDPISTTRRGPNRSARRPRPGWPSHGEKADRHGAGDAGDRPAGIPRIGRRNTGSENMAPMATQPEGPRLRRSPSDNENFPFRTPHCSALWMEDERQGSEPTARRRAASSLFCEIIAATRGAMLLARRSIFVRLRNSDAPWLTGGHSCNINSYMRRDSRLSGVLHVLLHMAERDSR